MAPYAGLPFAPPSNAFVKGHMFIPYIKTLQDDFRSVMKNFKKIGTSRDSPSQCGESKDCKE